MIRKLLCIATAIVLLALAGVLFWAGFEGLVTGEVAVATRGSSSTLDRSSSPIGYWIDVATWLGAGVGTLVASFAMLRKARIR